MADEQVTLKWSWGRSAAPVMQQTQLGYLAIDITPPTAMSVAVQNKTPLNLALVLDHSGSMDEDNKLEQLKEAVKQVIDLLEAGDSATVVVFSDNARVIVPATPVTDEGKTQMKKAVDGIRVAGGTTMSRGMLLGLDELKKVRTANPAGNYLHRMILLTDGQTWGDEPGGDEPVCKDVARQAGEVGISIIALGLGTDWNESLLDAIADNSKGQSDFINKPDEIAKYFERTVQEMKEAVVQNATLTMRLGGGVEARTVYQMTPMIRKLKLDTMQTENVIIVQLGELSAGKAQTVLSELLLPARPAGTFRVAQLQFTYEVPAAGGGSRELQSDVTLTYEEAPAEAPREALNPRVMNLVEKATAFKLQTTALSEAEVGNIAGATSKLRAAATRLLNLGEVDLANQAEAEASNLEAQGKMSAAGTKKLTFATRKLAQTELPDASQGESVAAENARGSGASGPASAE